MGKAEYVKTRRDSNPAEKLMVGGGYNGMTNWIFPSSLYITEH